VGDVVDKVIATIARRQGGYITRAQLLRLGLTAEQIKYRIRIGRLIPVYRGVYAVGHLPRLPVARAHGALLACGPRSVLSHRSAASLWGFYTDWKFPFEVTTREDRRPRGITVHLSRTLIRTDVRTQLGVRTTSPARTVFDMAPRLNDRQLQRQVDDGRNRHYVHIGELWDLAMRLPHAPAADRITELLSGGHNPTRSELEALFVEICVLADVPMPLLNVIVGGVEVDAYFPEQGLIVELDSHAWHSGRRVFESDRKRDREHLRDGLPTIRFTWESMTFDPHGEAALLRDVLGFGRAAA
jgi:hypothetical protein